jgi:hypothetical protein
LGDNFAYNYFLKLFLEQISYLYFSFEDTFVYFSCFYTFPQVYKDKIEEKFVTPAFGGPTAVMQNPMVTYARIRENDPDLSISNIYHTIITLLVGTYISSSLKAFFYLSYLSELSFSLSQLFANINIRAALLDIFFLTDKSIQFKNAWDDVLFILVPPVKEVGLCSIKFDSDYNSRFVYFYVMTSVFYNTLWFLWDI